MRDGGAPGGLLLAAGAGRRMGTPKALVDDWLIRGVDVIAAAGCSPVVVVLGAALQQAQALLQGLPVIVSATADWRNGLGASLRSGILALPAETPAAVVMLVDLPDVGEKVIRRVLEAGSGPGTLTRASYHGRPGHPVVLGQGPLARHSRDREWRCRCSRLPRPACAGTGRMRRPRLGSRHRLLG